MNTQISKYAIPEFDLDDMVHSIEAESAPVTWTIDPRLALFSYSDRATLHSCPRKYQLQKISKAPRQRDDNVTLMFGQVVGIGIQSSLENKSWNQVVLDMFMGWTLPDLLATEDRMKKGFFEAIFAIQQFAQIRKTVLADYELAYFHGKPAVEFAFRISVIGEIKYRSKIDGILRNKITGELLVLEDKTTYYKDVHESSYGNSSQATGYSIILDQIAPDSSEYDVLYLIYKTTEQEFETLRFTKHFSDRANWIKELLMDCDLIQTYETAGYYPAYGESCRNFGRDCEFYGTCKMSISALSLPYDPVRDTLTARYEEGYHIELDLMDIIDNQLTKGEI